MEKESSVFQIAGREIHAGKTFVIAEIGNNHNGDFERAKGMVVAAKDAGANCVKFQMRNMESVYRKKSLALKGEDLGTEYTLDLLSRFQLDIDQHKQLSHYCESLGIPYLCTPWDSESVATLEEIGVPAFKVASADLTNLPLLEVLSATGKPLIVSTGMSSEPEIINSVEFLKARCVQFCLLHCNSTYPAPVHDINLRYMNRLKLIHPIVGYSGHERGVAVSHAAVAAGAIIIERHFTLDRNMEGPDHAASLEPEEFKSLVTGILDIESAMGEELPRNLSQGEMINREVLGKSLVASKPLKKGHAISAEDVVVLSPGQGLSPQRYSELVGKRLERDVDEEGYFFESDITETTIEPRAYKFNRPWGVPVRYHDFELYAKRMRPKIVEFHLSYTDMELQPGDYLNGAYECGFAVHAPELFQNSKLMDLASPDEAYREMSLTETQRVIDITRNLKQYFPQTPNPVIVANVGGFSMDAPIELSEKDGYYARLKRSMAQLDTDGVEIIPQTMAPFPWHFGGQRYQNLLVEIDEIEFWNKEIGFRMCFDVSHSHLSCQHLEEDFYDFAARIAPLTAHIHMGDALGVNGEGLQIGEGEIDFDRLTKILDKGCPSASFIPEIWQGHKNNGAGFCIALEKLEAKF